MTAVHEISAGFDFIINTLKNDATLVSLCPGDVRRSFAPVGTTLPCVIVSFQSGVDTVTANGMRLLVRALYLVKASGLMISSPSVFALASQIDIVLGGNQGLRNIAVTGGFVMSCYRESAAQYDENITGTSYTHMGGLYRVTSQQM